MDCPEIEHMSDLQSFDTEFSACNLGESLSAYSSWSIDMENMHFSRDDEYYDNVLAAFTSYKPFPINIMQSDLESVQDSINLGQYGRIVTRPNQSLLVMNTIDQEMSEEEQLSTWEIYHSQCLYVLLNANIIKSLTDGLLEDLSTRSGYKLESRSLLDQLQWLRSRAMDMVNKTVTQNLSRDNLTIAYWDRISKTFDLKNSRSNIVTSISDLTEYVETSRRRQNEKLVFVLSVLVGPLTLLTDMMGGLLGDLYPGVSGFIGTVLTTYVIAICLVGVIFGIFKLMGRRKMNHS